MNQTLYLLQSVDRQIQQRSATALAMLLKSDLKKAFVDRPGLEILGRMIKDYPCIPHIQKQAAGIFLFPPLSQGGTPKTMFSIGTCFASPFSQALIQVR